MGEVVEVDSKGRIVIPISIRNKLALKEGDQLVAEIRSDEIVIYRVLEENVLPIKSNGLKDFLSE